MACESHGIHRLPASLLPVFSTMRVVLGRTVTHVQQVTMPHLFVYVHARPCGMAPPSLNIWGEMTLETALCEDTPEALALQPCSSPVHRLC